MDLEDIILQAAKHGEYAGVYCLGPDVGRVSFVSQQYRALNLVWALERRREFLAGNDIAIIGAGLSGLTAAAALLAHGARVIVYDEGAIEIPRQNGTTVRHIHPKINWWPSAEDDTLNPTTDLPFLNWRGDNCAEVIRQVMESWETLKNTYRDELKIVTRHKAEKIDMSQRYKQPIIQFPSGQSQPFTLVIMAIGFNKEKSHPLAGRHKDIFATSEYWDNDNIERERNHGRYKTFIVSGFGDGGLIDVMRLAFKGNSGYVAYELALALEHPDLKAERAGLAELEKLEERPSGGDPMIRMQRYRDMARKIYLARETYEDSKQTRSDLEPYLPASDLMARTLMKDRAYSIHAVDIRHSHPIRGEAAPIYKLMAAIVEIADVARFHHGSITVGPELKPGEKASRKTAADKVNIEAIDDNGRQQREAFNTAETLVIVRHGADPALKEFFMHRTGYDYTGAIAAKERAKSYNYQPAWRERDQFRDPHVVPTGVKSRDKDLAGYIETYYERALTAMKMLNFQGWLTAEVDKFLVIGHRPHYRPRHLYGVEVDYRGFEEIRSARIDDD